MDQYNSPIPGLVSSIPSETARPPPRSPTAGPKEAFFGTLGKITRQPSASKKKDKQWARNLNQQAIE